MEGRKLAAGKACCLGSTGNGLNNREAEARIGT